MDDSTLNGAPREKPSNGLGKAEALTAVHRQESGVSTSQASGELERNFSFLSALGMAFAMLNVSASTKYY